MPSDSIIARLSPIFILTAVLAVLPFVLIAINNPTPPPSRANNTPITTNNITVEQLNNEATNQSPSTPPSTLSPKPFCKQLSTTDCPLTCIIVSDSNSCDTCYCPPN